MMNFISPPINDNEKFEVIAEYYETNGLGKYDGNMFCPKCKNAALKFTPKAKSHRAFLSAIDNTKHLPGCPFQHDKSKTAYNNANYDDLNQNQIEDKLASFIRKLKKQSLGSSVSNGHSQNPSHKPLVPTSGNNQTTNIKRTLRSKNLDNSLKKEDADFLCTFYAIDAILTVKEEENKKNPNKPLCFLYINTISGNEYRIYRGTHKDIVAPNQRYTVVLIGYLNKFTLKNNIKQIELIKTKKENGFYTNTFSLVYE